LGRICFARETRSFLILLLCSSLINLPVSKHLSSSFAPIPCLFKAIILNATTCIGWWTEEKQDSQAGNIYNQSRVWCCQKDGSEVSNLPLASRNIDETAYDAHRQYGLCCPQLCHLHSSQTSSRSFSGVSFLVA